MLVRNNLHGKYISRQQRRIESLDVTTHEHGNRINDLTNHTARMLFYINQIAGYLSRTAGVEWDQYPDDMDEDEEDEGMYVENPEGEQCPAFKQHT